MANDPGVERRTRARLEILGDLPGEVTVFQPMTIRELSPAGAQIETQFALQINSLHTVRLELGDLPVVARARVVHCEVIDVDQDHLLYRSGLEFVEPTPQVSEAIRLFVDRLRFERQAE
jgi:hypothetical protein